MSSRRVLTLKYRPQTFDEVWAQEHVRTTLKRAIETDRLANAYLFAGPRGVGKTTCARILAKSLNCEQGPTVTPCNRCTFCLDITASRSLDVIELDGASNRGIEQIRELRENIKYAPAASRYKVYIVDEVHMLTKEAFNALLKTLEEPPRHAKFIFATTAAHAVPTTIISRCQRFDFRKATPLEIRDRLAWLAKQENIKISDSALMAIARRADGAIRDAESILDQTAAYRPTGIDLADVEELLGLVPSERFFDYAQLLAAGDSAGLLRFLDSIFESGYDHIEFFTGLVEHFRNLLLLDITGAATSFGLLPEEAERFSAQARSFGRDRLLLTLARLTEVEPVLRRSQLPRVQLEVMTLDLLNQGSHGTAATKPKKLPNNETSPPQPRQTSVDQTLVWSEVRRLANERQPFLASLLDLASAGQFDGNILTIAFPTKQQLVAAKVESESAFLNRLLTEVVGHTCVVRVVTATQPASDPIKERLARVYGRVEEERPE